MGRYYDETKMGSVRADLERRVATWPGVHAGQMFGCPCFDANGKLFAFVATNGVVLTQLEWSDRAELAKLFRAGPFAPEPGRAATKWAQVPATKPADLEPLLPWIRKSYETAKAAAGGTPKGPATPRPKAAPRKRRKARTKARTKARGRR